MPKFLTEAKDLNEDASLQYQNVWKEFYVIVIDESKAEFNSVLEENNLTDQYQKNFNGYSKLILESFDEKTIKNIQKSKVIDTLINNMPAKHLTIKGTVDGFNVFYSLAYLEGKDKYYQILTWTDINKESEYKEQMKQIIYSIKEVKKSKKHK